MYPSTTHCRLCWLKPRSCLIDGRAMLRIDASRMSMNWTRLSSSRIAMPRREPSGVASTRRPAYRSVGGSVAATGTSLSELDLFSLQDRAAEACVTDGGGGQCSRHAPRSNRLLRLELRRLARRGLLSATLSGTALARVLRRALRHRRSELELLSAAPTG